MMGGYSFGQSFSKPTVIGMEPNRTLFTGKEQSMQRTLDVKGRTSGSRIRSGFTLIELLVVISIIAMLVSILLPARNKARGVAHAIKCAANLKSIGMAMNYYLNDYDYYPPSYVYPYDSEGHWNLGVQDVSHPYGYVHWSWFLFENGQVDDDVFACPGMTRGGAPRTNPGPEAADWEDGQVDQNGQSQPNQLKDKQASRMGYTANAAIVPRNKFSPVNSGGPRTNRLVKFNKVQSPSEVILATEFNKNWKALGIGSSNSILSKSHRPICAFSHVSTGYAGDALYKATTLGFVYGDRNAEDYGLKPLEEVEQCMDLIDGGAGHPINAVGRHHPGGDEYGGTANFLYCDTHVERKTILQTMEKTEWGMKFYSLGDDIVRP